MQANDNQSNQSNGPFSVTPGRQLSNEKMRRMRRYGYEHYDNIDSKHEEAPRLPYFLHEKFSNNRENTHSSMKHPTNDYDPYENCFSSNGFSKSEELVEEDEDDYYYKERRRRDVRHKRGGNQSDDGDDYDDDPDDVYEVVSEGYLTPSSRAYNRFSEPDIRRNRDTRASQRKPVPKKIVCKYCATCKQPGSCPCPIHLPTVQSRYMRVLQDNARNALAINVFRNGDYRVTPTMINIPKFYMRSMEDIMKLVDKFVRFPVGYAYALYTVFGDLVEEPNELEPYEMYVVVNNCKKQFIPLEYGSKSPSTMNTGRRRRTIPQSTFALARFNKAHGYG